MSGGMAREATAVPGEETVRAATLANGMKVIVWPGHDIPNVALYKGHGPTTQASSFACRHQGED